MLETVLVLAAFVVLRRQLSTLATTGTAGTLAPRRSSPQLAQMTAYADRLYAEKKWLAAEKAYLGVLKLDHKNVTAYSHLGIIYSTQKSLADAVECFAIATQLKPSGVTYQNLALAYYDNRNYMKSVAAYEKAIMFEATAPRYIGLSKACRKLSNLPQTIAALEKAAEIEPSKRVLQLLADTYIDAGQKTEATRINQRLQALDSAN